MEEVGDRVDVDQPSEELFLIAHKVRSAPAFDVAIKMICPHCNDANSCGDYEGMACYECEGEGFWWIIPTSGHRAYPYWYVALSQVLYCSRRAPSPLHLMPFNLDPPKSLPDHYPRNPTSRSRIDVTGLLVPSTPIKIQRRF